MREASPLLCSIIRTVRDLPGNSSISWKRVLSLSSSESYFLYQMADRLNRKNAPVVESKVWGEVGGVNTACRGWGTWPIPVGCKLVRSDRRSGVQRTPYSCGLWVLNPLYILVSETSVEKPRLKNSRRSWCAHGMKLAEAVTHFSMM